MPELYLQAAKWHLDDFLTVNPRLASEITRIRIAIEQYSSKPNEEQPFVTAICGEPGSGKSTLAKALGKVLKCKFIPSNAAQWTSVEDLFQVCERMRTARIEGHLPLVFVDEIDAELGGLNWY